MDNNKIIQNNKPKEDLSQLWFFRRKHLPMLFGFSNDSFDRWIREGRFPSADDELNGFAVWYRSTLERWAYKNREIQTC